MKKYLYMALVALTSFCLYSCGDEVSDEAAGDNGGQPGQNVVTPGSASIVGTWEMNTEDENFKVTFTNDTFVFDGGYAKTEGTYTTQNNTITLTPQKTYEAALDADYNIIPGKWNEVALTEDMKQPAKARLLLLNDSNVLVIEYQDTEGQNGYGLFSEFLLLFKKGATIKADESTVEGQWIWYFQGNKEIVRTYLNIKGGKFDLIIPIWAERYEGSVTYTNGMLNFKVERFTTRDRLGEENESYNRLFDGWHELTSEEMQWKTPSFGYSFSRPFIANGKQAYTYLANLPALFEKQ